MTSWWPCTGTHTSPPYLSPRGCPRGLCEHIPRTRLWVSANPWPCARSPQPQQPDPEAPGASAHSPPTARAPHLRSFLAASPGRLLPTAALPSTGARPTDRSLRSPLGLLPSAPSSSALPSPGTAGLRSPPTTDLTAALGWAAQRLSSGGPGLLGASRTRGPHSWGLCRCCCRALEHPAGTPGLGTLLHALLLFLGVIVPPNPP